MADPDPNQPEEEIEDDVDALEQPEPSDSQEILDDAETNEETIDAVSDASKHTAVAEPPKVGIKGRFAKFNIYLLLFIFILLIAGGILLIAYFQGKKQTSTTLKTQSLTDATLKQLATSDASIGSVQQVLNIQSSAVFAGKVLIRDGLEVATSLKVGGTSSLTGLNVSGTTQLQQVQINKDLAVAGNTALQGSTTIAKNLQVSGTGNFGGALSAPQITTNNLQLNADLVLTHHIVAGGVTPRLSNGTALGAGGTASVSGSDTAGNVVINVGSSAAAGCFATINFADRYSSTPHVLLTPVGSSSGNLNYYVNRTATSFSICNSTAPAPGSYGFDYFVVN